MASTMPGYVNNIAICLFPYNTWLNYKHGEDILIQFENICRYLNKWSKSLNGICYWIIFYVFLILTVVS